MYQSGRAIALLPANESLLKELDKEIEDGTDWSTFASVLADAIAPPAKDESTSDSNSDEEWKRVEAVINNAAVWKEVISHFDSKTLGSRACTLSIHRIWIVAAVNE